jgi:hypothetical protein
MMEMQLAIKAKLMLFKKKKRKKKRAKPSMYHAMPPSRKCTDLSGHDIEAKCAY